MTCVAAADSTSGALRCRAPFALRRAGESVGLRLVLRSLRSSRAISEAGLTWRGAGKANGANRKCRHDGRESDERLHDGFSFPDVPLGGWPTAFVLRFSSDAGEPKGVSALSGHRTCPHLGIRGEGSRVTPSRHLAAHGHSAPDAKRAEDSAECPGRSPSKPDCNHSGRKRSGLQVDDGRGK